MTLILARKNSQTSCKPAQVASTVQLPKQHIQPVTVRTVLANTGENNAKISDIIEKARANLSTTTTTNLSVEKIAQIEKMIPVSFMVEFSREFSREFCTKFQSIIKSKANQSISKHFFQHIQQFQMNH